MSFAAGVVELLRTHGEVTARLADRDPVAVDGWRSDGKRLLATVRFGPYAETVRTTSVTVSLNGHDQVILFNDVMSLPPGVAFDYDLRVSLADD